MGTARAFMPNPPSAGHWWPRPSRGHPVARGPV